MIIIYDTIPIMSINQQLSDAISSHDTELAMALVDKLPHIDIDSHAFIIHNNRIDRIQFLINHNIKLPFEKLMQDAIRDQNLPVIQYLLESKYIDPNEQFYFHETRSSDDHCDYQTNYESWIHFIIFEYNRYEMSHYIYDTDADDVICIMADTILSMIKMFVAFGANLNVVNGHGKHIMSYVAGDFWDHGHPNAHDYKYSCSKINNKLMGQVIKHLIEAGFYADTKDSYGYPLLCIIMNSFEFSDSELDLVKFLVDHGADLNGFDKHGSTPLHWIIRRLDRVNIDDVDADFDNVDLGILHYMLGHGANQFITNGYVKTPFKTIRNDKIRAIFYEWG